jgi:large subunit ribosomal protein L9
MKVLLCEDVKTLGWLGDVVNVSEGYARNYLLPQGLAKIATEANIKAIAKNKAKRAEQRIHERKRMEEAAKAVEGAEAVLAAKANEQGVLFGSITAEQIAANLRSQGFEVADDVVQLPEHIKQLGAHSVILKYDKDLSAAVNVVVVPASASESQRQDDKRGEPQGDVSALASDEGSNSPSEQNSPEQSQPKAEKPPETAKKQVQSSKKYLKSLKNSPDPLEKAT